MPNPKSRFYYISSVPNALNLVGKKTPHPLHVHVRYIWSKLDHSMAGAGWGGNHPSEGQPARCQLIRISSWCHSVGVEILFFDKNTAKSFHQNYCINSHMDSTISEYLEFISLAEAQ